jgi:septum site-determining protein MinD
LLSIATANVLVVILRPDRQDLQGTAVMVDLARQLKVPKMLMVVNRVLQDIDVNAVRQQIEAKYDVPVVGILHNCDEMMRLGSSALFCLEYPDHPLTREIKTVAQSVMT